MAALADLKRQQYRDNGSPFQRPAPDALKVHEAFLARLLDWDGFVVLVRDGPDGVDGLAVARVGSAPPPFGEGAALLHVDDFMVSAPAPWESVGRKLLEQVARKAAAAGATNAIVVCGGRTVDAPKADFLASLGLAAEAEWWVKRVEPTRDEPGTKTGVRRDHRPCATRLRPRRPHVSRYRH